MKKQRVSERTVGRLSFYRRTLYELADKKIVNVYSHQLASAAGVTAAQVRRDLMVVGCPGSPRRGYNVRELLDSMTKLLDAPDPQGVALIGVGNLGRAVIAYFSRRHPKLRIVTAFDKDPKKTNRLVHGCYCYSIDKLPTVFKEKGTELGIITVPVNQAQEVADMLVRSGVKGIMNFAPVPLSVPTDVYVENMDITTSLEKVAYFARR